MAGSLSTGFTGLTFFRQLTHDLFKVMFLMCAGGGGGYPRVKKNNKTLFYKNLKKNT
jgi:hypothetical protein